VYQSTVRVLHAGTAGVDSMLLVLDAPEIASEAQPGQFVMVRCGEQLLRRPISVHAAFGGKMALLFRIAGSGTRWLAGVQEGAWLDILGPLGTGYSLSSDKGRAVLVAGGIGIAPLCFLAARLAVSSDVVLVHGTRSESELYRVPDGLRRLMPEIGVLDGVEWVYVTDDGSVGICGTALQAALPCIEEAVRVYLCGPHAMCLAANEFVCDEGEITVQFGTPSISPGVHERLMSGEVSLEVRMGCGVGACYACSIPTREGRKKVCKDGPVFRFGDIIWEEICT